jgi:DNA repair protein RecO (recombination protein O)
MAKLQAIGYVIHRRPYRETSVIVDFFTRQYGRISAVAKGARGAGKSDRKSLMQPLQLLSFELNGRSQLKNLGLAEAVRNPWAVKGVCLYSAFYLNELLIRALPETEPMSLLFELYQDSLEALANESESANKPDVEPILRNFELMLLQELGYLPDFNFTSDTSEPIVAELSYTFIAEEGFIVCSPVQRFAIKGADLLAIAQRNFDPSARKVAKWLCRQSLLPIIGDKPLKSRELFLMQGDT